MEKKIKVFVQKRVNHETKEEFNVYKALTKQGKVDLKFRKEVENLPTQTCYVVALEENISINQKFEYPVMWISKIERLEELKFEQNLEEYLD